MLLNNRKPWAPEDRPNYLCLLSSSQHSPKNREEFLLCQSTLLSLLIDQANEGEIDDANNRLEDSLEQEFLISLPDQLLRSPSMTYLLMFNPAIEGSPLDEWKTDLYDLLDLPPMPEEQALEEAKLLDLESYLGRLL